MSIRRIATVALLSALAVACSEDGKDLGNACPELPLYDINDPDLTQAERQAIARASQTNNNGRCITPIGTALTDPNAPRPPSSTGGAGGAGGSGGSGGAGDPDAG